MTRVSQRTRYLNAVNTIKELLSMGVVPIVNENDTVSVSVGSGSPYRLNEGLIFMPGN
jgi:glutamate 5-kinase